MGDIFDIFGRSMVKTQILGTMGIPLDLGASTIKLTFIFSPMNGNVVVYIKPIIPPDP